MSCSCMFSRAFQVFELDNAFVWESVLESVSSGIKLLGLVAGMAVVGMVGM